MRRKHFVNYASVRGGRGPAQPSQPECGLVWWWCGAGAVSRNANGTYMQNHKNYAQQMEIDWSSAAQECIEKWVLLGSSCRIWVFVVVDFFMVVVFICAYLCGLEFERKK